MPVLTTAQKRLYRQYMSPELLCSLFPAILCEDQPATTSFSGGKKPEQIIYKTTIYIFSFQLQLAHLP